jgi:F0F1-type ATP synthase membrane subunit c/vacuolar-type H+-ATPase subunit K
MELQPIVGSACAHCKKNILVDVDGKNCLRCGLAIHRRCAKHHRAECAGRPVLAAVAHDYDEVPPLQWTTRLIAILSAGAFLTALGLGALLASPPEPPPGVEARPPSTVRLAMGWGGLLVGLAVLGGGYAWERGRQTSAARRAESVRTTTDP